MTKSYVWFCREMVALANYPLPGDLYDVLNRFKKRIEALEFRPQWAAAESRITATTSMTIPDAVKWVWIQAAGPVTITLPQMLDGKVVNIKNFNAVTVTVNTADGSTIDGNASISFSSTTVYRIQSDGTVWLSM
jgi:hypothetical protein